MKENQSNATSYYRTPEKENTCPDYEQIQEMRSMAGQSTNQEVTENRQKYLGKRTLRFEIERELELYIPSKFFLVTNNFFKVKQVRM